MCSTTCVRSYNDDKNSLKMFWHIKWKFSRSRLQTDNWTILENDISLNRSITLPTKCKHIHNISKWKKNKKKRYTCPRDRCNRQEKKNILSHSLDLSLPFWYYFTIEKDVDFVLYWMWMNVLLIFIHYTLPFWKQQRVVNIFLRIFTIRILLINLFLEMHKYGPQLWDGNTKYITLW